MLEVDVGDLFIGRVDIPNISKSCAVETFVWRGGIDDVEDKDAEDKTAEDKVSKPTRS